MSALRTWPRPLALLQGPRRLLTAARVTSRVIPRGQDHRASLLVHWPLLFGLYVDFAVLTVWFFPTSLNFNWYAFGDRGSTLTVDWLTAHGATPSIDFGYSYGLLSVQVGRLLFDLLGRNPLALQAGMVVCASMVILSVAIIARTIRLGAAQLMLLLAALGLAVLPAYPTLAHALEASLLAGAIAAHVRGSIAYALAFATAAIFVGFHQ